MVARFGLDGEPQLATHLQHGRVGGEHHAVGISNGYVGTAPIQWPDVNGNYPSGGDAFTFARKRQTTRAMVDVNQVVRETLALRAYEQRVTNISVIDALAAGLPQVFADGHHVQQVLLNLVINAEQAMLATNGRGTIVVRTWHDANQESVVLEINDDGPGIPNELQPKIFDPFFTTKAV